jgi:hypothetical protein
VAGAIAGNISREATQPSGNVLVEAMRGELDRAFDVVRAVAQFMA